MIYFDTSEEEKVASGAKLTPQEIKAKTKHSATIAIVFGLYAAYSPKSCFLNI